MADSCAGLRAEIAALRAEINALKQVDEEAIAERGAKKAETRLNPAIVAATLVGTTALGLAQKAIARILAFLAALASLEAIVAGILAAIAIIYVLQSQIKVLFGRVDAIDGEIASLKRGLNQVKDLATRALGVGIDAKLTAKLAHDRIDTLEQFIEELQRRIGVAEEKANEAILKANKAINKADTATATANKAIAQSNEAIGKANKAIKDAENAQYAAKLATFAAIEAQSLARTASQKADAASQKADAASQKADAASEKADRAFGEALSATVKAEVAQFKANEALGEAQTATARANRAYSEAVRAGYKADRAINTANEAIEKASKALGEIPPVSQTASNAKSQSGEAIRIANGAVTKIIYYGKIIEPTVIGQVQTVVPTVVAQSIAQAQQTQQQQYSHYQNAVNQLQSQVQQLVPTGVQGIPITAIVGGGTIVQQVNKVDELQTEINALKPRVTNIENNATVNNTKLDNIATGLAALPAAVGTVLAPKLITPAQVQSAAQAGTCDAAKPGGCLGVPTTPAGAKDLSFVDALSTGVQTAQAATLLAITNTLNSISAVLGTNVIPGGLSSGFSRFISWSGIDRICNLVTMLGVIHNCFMLSNSITESFFSALDNILAIPTLITNPEGETLDSKKIATETLDKFFVGLFGATEWAAIKAQYKAYSTIYSSAAQAFNNSREIMNDTQELMNSARNYTAQLGNALVDEGLISEDNWDYKDPNHKTKSKSLNRLNRMAQGLETVEDSLEAIEQVTATLRNITETANEIKENIEGIEKGINDANKAAQTDRDAKIEGLDLPNFSLDDLF